MMESPHKVRERCASCESDELHTIMDYGTMTLAGFFPKQANAIPDDRRFPLSLLYCPSCHLVQTDSTIEPDVLFKDYRYVSSVGLQGHFNGLAEFISKMVPDDNARILEIGSNDGSLLLALHKKGYMPIGMDPSENIWHIAKKRLKDYHYHGIWDYFRDDTARRYFDRNSFDLITASNCLAHIDDIHDVIDGIEYCLKDDGYLVMEAHYGRNIFETLQFDNVYHEHIFYYTAHSLKSLFSGHGLSMVNVEQIPVHSGSLRVTFRKGDHQADASVLTILEAERASGMLEVGYYDSFTQRVMEYRAGLMNILSDLKCGGKAIIGYGASGRANTLCGFVGIDHSLVDCIIDESPERAGRFIGDIPILSPTQVDIKENTVVVVFAWNYAKMIMKKLEGRGLKFLIPFPEPRMVTSVDEISEMISL